MAVELWQQTGGWMFCLSEWLHVWLADRHGPIKELSDADTFSSCVSDVTCNPADASHADTAVSATQRWAAQASSGWGSGRTSAEVSGAEQSGGNQMQTEEKSVGDVIREESGRAHSDQHAASGTQWTSGVDNCNNPLNFYNFNIYILLGSLWYYPVLDKR